MLIYILHFDKIYTFRLPLKVEGKYVLQDYDLKGIRRSLISVSAVNGKWVFNSSDNFKIIYDNKSINNINVELYNFYQIVSLQNEKIILFTSPSFDENFISKKVKSGTTLVIGNDSKNDIVYSYAGISAKQIELTYANERWTLKNLNTNIPIYINKIKKDYGSLNSLDTIFVMGLKILLCGPIIFISSPNGMIHMITDKFLSNENELIVQDYKTASVSSDFYSESDYFFMSPVFKKKNTSYELNITPPPSKEDKSKDSILLSVIPSALMSLTSVVSCYFTVKDYRNGSGNKESLISNLLMCGIMLLVSIVWPFVEKFASKIRWFVNEKTRIRKYKRYLKRKKAILEQVKNEQKTTLQMNNISVEECSKVIRTKDTLLFSRNMDNDDFLNIRLGLGKTKLLCHTDYVRQDSIDDSDKLLDKLDNLIEEYKYIDNAPYVISLNKNPTLAFLSSIPDYSKYMNAIILQLITFHSPINLKLVLLTTDSNGDLSLLKDLNHCWNDEKDFRFFATNLQEAENVSSYLVKEFNKRINIVKDDNKQKNINSPYYLIVTDSVNQYKMLKIIENVLGQDKNRGFGIIMFDQKLANIPSGCSSFIDYNNSIGSFFKTEMGNDQIGKFKPEFITETSECDFQKCVRMLSNIPLQLDNEVNGTLPEKVGFLELYGLGMVEQINSRERWLKSDIINSLSAPVGVDASGNILDLDLHERKHGPHGLIAGMTGSGKSEFIVTYILSLAINYSPYEVQFVLIDYKGGGLAGAFENRKTGLKLPHLVGTITNLDKSSMNRTLVSIQSELQRRQRVFNEAKERLNTGTIDIYKYQKLVREGSLEQPLSHLFIICDEFAELKSQQPDFMDQLVSAARIGRSLGIHLILATQKPSGVVDDQIWSNSKFKVCCKVQTAEDSNEMIRRPDAAYIKESGRFYLQVGYDEYFVKGQSAYTGTAYIPSETVTTTFDDSIEFIDTLGNVIKTVKEEKKVKKETDLGEELGNVLRYLIETAKSMNLKDQQLWLDNIAPSIYIDNVRKKYNTEIKPYIINPLIGEYDDPENQSQGAISIDITNDGNLYICGISGSGKTTLISTLIYSIITTHNSSEVNIYIVDFMAENLKKFVKAPQVSDFFTIADSDKIKKMFYFLKNEISKRKKYYSNRGGSFSYDVKKGKAPFPNIIVIINGGEVFRDEFDELYTDLFTTIVRDSIRVGIYFVIAATGTSALGVTVENNFSQKIALRLLDTTDYNMMFTKSTNIIPASNPGRGLIEKDKVYEFQTAMIFDESILEKNLSYVIEQLNRFLNKAPRLPIMPKIVSTSILEDDINTIVDVPIGINIKSNCASFYDFSDFITLILCNNDKIASTMVPSLCYLLNKTKNVKLFVLNIIEETQFDEEIKVYNENFRKILRSFQKNAENKIKEMQEKVDNLERIVFVINGYTKLQAHMKKLETTDNSLVTLDDLILYTKDSNLFKFILVDNINLFKSLDDKQWSDYIDPSNGIVVGTESDNQEIIDYNEGYDSVKVTKDIAILFKNGEREYIKYAKKSNKAEKGEKK